MKLHQDKSAFQVLLNDIQAKTGYRADVLEKDCYVLEIRMEEEIGRLDGIPGVVPNKFVFFTQAGENADVRKAYEIMQNQYALRLCDRIDFDTASSVLRYIQGELLGNPAWALCRRMEPTPLDQ